MKMTRFLKSMSRTVHEEHHDQLVEHKTDDQYHEATACPSSLTVWRKSLVISCNGFTVINSGGNLVYRVDNYSGRPEEITLMDGSGIPVHTMRRCKTLRLVDSWFVYEGEAGDHHCRTSTSSTKSSKKPICSVRKHVNILHSNPNVLAHVFRGSSNKGYAYVIEGSYAHRSCKVLDESRKVVAEIKRKEASKGGVSFGHEVFVLVVRPGFDPGFAMALVLLLDQMCS
ncbi:protein LURP-one-related 17 [Castanea sativa]|uniref:protein LURP-one-related 17 n=1 Tax=Castanea sativa TaxID=21020 RepID=UPI003F64EA9E